MKPGDLVKIREETGMMLQYGIVCGIVLREDYEFDDLKPLFMNKAHTNKYHPFILPLHERDYHEVIAKGDALNTVVVF